MNFRKLRPDEIEVRVGKNTSKGVVLLLYKDARCDMAILDETVGILGWQRKHVRDNANCIVSIWDNEKKLWIEKEDTGTESFTEKEKGLASDSFKRACFNWGIGRELYTAPLIFIAGEMEQGAKPMPGKELKKLLQNIRVSHIAYTDDKISELTLDDGKGLQVYSWKAKAFTTKQPTKAKKAPQSEEKPKVDMITETQYEILKTQAKELEIDLKKVLATYNVKKGSELTSEQYGQISLEFMEMETAKKGK